MGLELLLEPAAVPFSVTPFSVEDFLLGVLLQPCDVFISAAVGEIRAS